MSEQSQFQLALSDLERGRLGNRVLENFNNARADHDARQKRWIEYYRRWRARPDVPGLGDEEKSNFPVPVIRWNVKAAWAKEMDSLFGEDSEIVAVPVGPSDYKRVKKISKYMTWRVFDSMKLTNPFCVFDLRKLIFGRSIAYSPWEVKTYDVKKNNSIETITEYEGPGFYPLHPDDFIVPAEDVNSLHEFSWVMRKYRVTPSELLQGEKDGRYQGISQNWDSIVSMSRQRSDRDPQGDELKREQDDAEGVWKQNALTAGDSLEVLEWYGKWRMLKSQSVDADEYNTKARNVNESEIMVRYIDDLNLVIGIQDLMDLYPTIPKRRPFVEASMEKDGSYWCAGLGEKLIDIEDEVRANNNQGADGQGFAISPVVFYRPGSGFDPERFKYEPGIAIPLDNPGRGKDWDFFQPTVDLNVVQVQEQRILAYGERVTGLSDLALGRSGDRPNEPKTARGTVALLQEGNVILSLDKTVLEEDMTQILAHFWQLEYAFASEETFFRVTEDDADGLFPVNNGGSMLSMKTVTGAMTSALNSLIPFGAEKRRKSEFSVGISLTSRTRSLPRIPVALWEVTRQAHEALGDPNFEDMVPKPPQPDMPIDPKVEWTMMLQGETVHVNPQDNDQLHLIRHMADIQRATADPQTDPDALKELKLHYLAQIQQLEHKQVMQAILERGAQLGSQIAQTEPGACAAASPDHSAGERSTTAERDTASRAGRTASGRGTAGRRCSVISKLCVVLRFWLSIAVGGASGAASPSRSALLADGKSTISTDTALRSQPFGERYSPSPFI
jgi:hypothetical protein